MHFTVLVAFFLAYEDFGRMFDHSDIHSPPALLLLLLFVVVGGVFFKVEVSSRTLVPLFMPGSLHSGSASIPVL